MAREKRAWHQDFYEYMKKIVEHPNYAGMPEPYKEDMSIRWVVTPKSEVGRKRREWWENKRTSLGIPSGKGSLKQTARTIHPFGYKPCQVCGRKLSLDYVYPTKRTLEKLNSIPKLHRSFTRLEEIKEIIAAIIEQLGDPAYGILDEIFSIEKNNLQKTPEAYIKYIQEEKVNFFSPGAMSDPPDRFDGYHSYNLCCRSKEDTGRHADNLRRYGQDRRAYEFWADGDWKAADWLMKVFSKHGKSPDHVGPLSLGFSHRPKFNPMTLKENIDKRNVMSFNDVKTLIAEEAAGEQVASWHSKYIWDKLKNKIRNDVDAAVLSFIMRKNLHYVLGILAEIKNAGFSDFLIVNFLHPEYAYYSIEFLDFDPETGGYSQIKKVEGAKKQYENNAKRYIRISLTALDDYMQKDNRRVKDLEDKEIETHLDRIISYLKKKDDSSAKKELIVLLKYVAQLGEIEYDNEVKKS